MSAKLPSKGRDSSINKSQIKKNEERKNKFNNLESLPEYYSIKDKKGQNFKRHSNQVSTSNCNRTPSAFERHKYILGGPSFPSINQNKKSKQYKQWDGTEDDNMEEMSMIENLWEDLGVRSEYKILFKSNINQYEKSVRKQFINIESESLKKFKDYLTKLSKEITNRERSITLIHQLDEYVGMNIKKGFKNLSEELHKEIIKTIKTLRIHSVNVISHMNRFRELYYFYTVNGKYDLEKANSYYDYDKNYLNKMKNDLKFLKDSFLGYFFCFSKKSDPFLLSISVATEILRTEKQEYEKYIVPVNRDLMSAVVQSEFVMIQDNLFSQLKFKGNKKECASYTDRKSTDGIESLIDPYKGNKRSRINCENTPKSSKVNLSQMLFNLKQGPDYNHLFFSRNSAEKKDQIDPNKPKEKNKIKIERDEINTMTREELLKKFDEYEKLQNEHNNQKGAKGALNNNKPKNDKKTFNLNEVQQSIDMVDYNNKKNNNDSKNKSKQNENNESEEEKYSFDHSIAQNKEINSNREDESPGNYSIEYFTKPLSQLNDIYSDYYEKIPDIHQQIFNIMPISKINFIQGINPKIIVALGQNNSIAGICQVAYESLSSQTLKLKINHISSIARNWKTVFQLIIDFIKSSLEYDTIEVSLHYQYKKDRFIINKEILSLFKETLSFKWLKIENFVNKQRIQYLIYQNEQQRDDDYEPPSLLSIYSSSIISLSKYPRAKNIYSKYLNIFSLNFLINSLKLEGLNLTSSSQDKMDKINWNINAIQSGISGMISSYNSSLDSFKESLNSVFDLNDISVKSGNTQVSYSFIDHKPKLSSNYTVIKDGIAYNRITGNISILKDPQINQSIFLIPTEDNENSLLICEMTPELSDIFVNNEKNIYDIFEEYYMKLQQNPNEKVLTTSLWVPSFTVDSHIPADNASCLEDIKILDEEGTEKHINSIDEYISVSYTKDNNYKNNFQIEPKENDVIIKNSFLFGLVNSYLLSKMTIPSIMFLLVTPGSWEYIE